MTALPSGWSFAQVAEVAALTDGPFGSNLKTSHYVASGPRVVRLQNIGSGLFRDAEAHITKQHFDVLRKHEVEPGDIVAASLGDDGPRACLVPGWLGPAIVKADCIRIRPEPQVDAGFLMWMLNSPPVRQQASAMIKGVGRPRLGLGGLGRLSVPLPPLNEQRRIVAAIEEQFSRLDAADGLLADAEGRAHVLADRVVSVATDLGELRLVGELLDGIEAGKSFKCHSRPASENEWGVIKVSAMTWGSFREEENKAVLSDERVDPRWEILPGDLLLSRANTTQYVGATVLVANCRRRLLLSDKSMRLVVREGVDARWLRIALGSRSARAQMSAVATGTSDSMRNISQEKVRAVRIRVPVADQQPAIIAAVERQLSVIDALLTEITTAARRSAALRRSILQRAFRGELVAQDPSDEPAYGRRDRFRAEQADDASRKRRARR